MVRAPCCEKMGLKKGPWTAEEDQILIAYIDKHGHGNWRALPKLAGLLRCGKSCRLRWINYLRPDIKRGNFTREEEDTIIKLHEKMGNRWSAIASQLPGRTDNEIKNVWHTHLKKRLTNSQANSSDTKRHRRSSTTISQSDSISSVTILSELGNNNFGINRELESSACTTSNSGDSSSSSSSGADLSSNNADSENKDRVKLENMEDSSETVLPVIDDSFWSEASLNLEDSYVLPSPNFTSFPDNEILQGLFPFDSIKSMGHENVFGTNSDNHGMDFWYDLFVTAGEPLDTLENF